VAAAPAPSEEAAAQKQQGQRQLLQAGSEQPGVEWQASSGRSHAGGAVLESHVPVR